MKMEGTSGKLDTIRLKHKGQDFNFMHILPAISRENIAIKPTEIGLIEFEDIREIDVFIDTLKYFREYCELNIGKMANWKIVKAGEIDD